MRKFFSLFAAVLFAASMMASEVVFTNADFAGQGTANTGSEVSASKDGVTFTYSKGFSADESLRCYAHGALSISAEEKISKINFTTTGGKTGGLDAEVTVNAWDYEVADMASQARFTEIKVTLGEGGGDTPGGGDDPVLMTCAEAVVAAQAGSTQKATVIGYVTEIAYAWKNGSMSFWMADTKDGGKVFEAFKCECAEADAPAVGDLVEATGTLTMYNTTAELAAGCTVAIIEKAGGDTPVEPSMDYYVAGSMNGWAADAAYMLTPNNESLYQGEFTFAANDEFKVIGVEGETTTWFPGGMDNHFKITEAGDYKITFNPAGNVDGWYAGFFNVVKKEEPVIPQYEVAEAIAAGLTDDTEIEVRGVVTKMQIKGKNFANYGSACIYVKDATGAEGEFEFYNCYSFESAKFTSTIPAYDATSTAWADLTKLADANGNEIRLGDTIVAFGKYKLFNSTYELNTGCYIVDIKSAPVAPAQGINVNMSEGLFYDDHVADAGWWQLYGEDEHFVISVSNVETTQAEGTYTIADLDADWTYLGIIDGTDTTYVSFVDGSVNLSISAEGDVTVAGTLVGDDGNNYILNLVFVSPKPTVTVDVNIQNAELIDDYADYGLYGVYGMDANNVYVQLGIRAEDGFQGQFTEEDLDLKYIGSAIFEGEEQVNIYTAAITVTPGNNGSYNIEATILGYNNKQYNVTMTIPASEPTGIEETLATGKTVKVLRNGQLLIMKGEKTFDVMGARIR